MKKRVFTAFFCLLVCCSFSYGQNLEETLAPTSVRKLLSKLRQNIEKEKLNFRVGYNSALKYTIPELCGLHEIKAHDWWKKAGEKNLLKLKPVMLKVSSLSVGLPAKWDWRDQDGVTPVKDQGGCGSCWAFGTMGAVESMLRIKSDTTVDLSEQYLLSCNTLSYGCDGGWWAFDMLMDPGAVLETSFPYVAAKVACAGPYAYPFKVTGWAYVDGQDKLPSKDKIKQAIRDYGPVAAAVYVGEAFQSYTGGVFDKDELPSQGFLDCSESTDINHAIMLVGWDDSKSAWILRNSWGDGWGENGYMSIKYGTSNVGFAAVCVY
jgi:C1A family cysteine protease